MLGGRLDHLDVAQARRPEIDRVAVVEDGAIDADAVVPGAGAAAVVEQVRLAVLADDQCVPARDGGLVDLHVRAQAAPVGVHGPHPGQLWVVGFKTPAGGGRAAVDRVAGGAGAQSHGPTFAPQPEADLREV